MIIIDGNMLAHRTFHKMDFLANSSGVHTGMEFGFLRSIESLQRKFDDKIIICFDTKYNKKKEKCKRYKANRSKMKGTFYTRLSNLQKFLSNFWDMAWMEGEEADDVMYSLASTYHETSGDKSMVYLYSNDNDMLQCINNNICVLKSHDSSLYVWDEDKVVDKYGLPPELLVLYRAFVGDLSDSLKGVPRIQKHLLVDAILGAIDKGITEPRAIALCVSGVTSWSVNMSLRIQEFIDSGLWLENYELMKLLPVDYDYFDTKLNEELVVKQLREWEIGSLDLCKKYKEDLVDPESEF